MENRTLALPLPLPSSDSTDASSNGLSSISLDYTSDLSKAANSKVSSKKNREQLWLCLYFPEISLNIFSEQDHTKPQLVINEEGKGLFVHSVNNIARQFGITENMQLNAAYALCPELKLFRRNEEKELTHILSIANWAQTFSSQVSVISVEKVLLEVKGSLKLFSGLSSFLKMMNHSFAENFGDKYQLAVSPTPLASQLLAELSEKVVVNNEKELRSVIGPIAVDGRFF
jgi:protein ImuB